MQFVVGDGRQLVGQSVPVTERLPTARRPDVLQWFTRETPSRALSRDMHLPERSRRSEPSSPGLSMNDERVTGCGLSALGHIRHLFPDRLFRSFALNGALHLVARGLRMGAACPTDRRSVMISPFAEDGSLRRRTGRISNLQP